MAYMGISTSPATPVALSDGKPHSIRKFYGAVREWTRKQWRALRPSRPRAQAQAREKPLWWLRMQYNLVLSSLYQLPDELVLAICRDLEGSDVYIMRQTCSLFRRVLAAPEFVRSVELIYIGLYLITVKRSTVDLPNLQVDWDDVFERLRRRRCCSACIDARIPKQVGGASPYDTTMLRMANETKYCTECQAWHPLIMFSQTQREAEGGATCIMVEGGVAVCPHHTVSLRKLREWQDMIRNSSGELQPPPWLLRCDLCFQDLEDPLRSSAVQPSATCLLPEVVRTTASKGALCVQWALPLRVDAKAVVAAGDTIVHWRAGVSNSHQAEKVEKALSQAAEGYNDLLCPHVSFDDLHVFHDFTQDSYNLAMDFRRGWLTPRSAVGTHGFIATPDDPRAAVPSVLGICRVCSSPGRIRQLDRPWPIYEYFWGLGEHGLSLERHLNLPVPDLTAPFSPVHEAWLQMLSPPSYGLCTDSVLQHITWCPDKQCANGRTWASHQRHLDNIIVHHQAMKSRFSPQFYRERFSPGRLHLTP
ncbi:hypothetical protein PG994_000887 [Apiospora phragmitis]|uniref:F-box domain-containing protein n=1 Tax=Apiospora phragmitis TaxID=2905665 RepID=A0ABR1WR67_9PEZI